MTRRDQALKRCDELIAWYTKEGRRQRLAFQSFQVAASLLSGITPILILVLPPTLDGWAALPAALASIAVGLLGIFQWKENYIRFAYTGEALKGEKIKFETRTTRDYDVSLDDHQALSHFVARMEALVMSEVTDWRGLMQEATKDGAHANGPVGATVQRNGPSLAPNSSAPPSSQAKHDPGKSPTA
jgi:hypothetical protein